MTHAASADLAHGTQGIVCAVEAPRIDDFLVAPLTVVSCDDRIRANALALGYDIAPD